MNTVLFRRTACALFATLVAATPVRASEWTSLSGSYVVSLMGIPVGRFDLNGLLNERAYRLVGSGGVTGLARLVSSGQGRAESHGSFSGSRTLPARYTYAESTDSKNLAISMDLAGSGAVQRLSVIPPLDPHPERVPVTEAHRRGIVDPMSGLLFHVKGNGPLLTPAACARTVPIFDGRQRFDIELSYAGTREVDTFQGYKGTVIACRAWYKPVAGHRPTKREYAEFRRHQQIEVWLAPVEGVRVLVPYRVSIRTPVGEALVAAERFEARPASQAASPSSQAAQR